MAKHHGQLKDPIPQPRPEEIPIPRTLQRQGIISNLYGKAAEEKYGIWEMEALQDFDADSGPIKKGERFSIVGNQAVDLAFYRMAKFTDKRAIAEAELIAKAQELGFSANAKELQAFTGPTRPAPKKNEFVHQE